MSTYLVQFGNGNPSAYTGLSPTFIQFVAIGVGSTTPPGITEVPTTTGLYYFNYTPLSAVAFVLDGTATIPNSAIRYVSGLLDVENSQVGLMATLMGGLADSFGSTLADPTTIVGYLKRLQEFNEGNNVFTKTSGSMQYWSRGVTYASGSSVYAGSSLMLIEKAVTDSGSVITKI